MNCYGCEKHRPSDNSLVSTHVQNRLTPDILTFDPTVEVASTGLVPLRHQALIVKHGIPSMCSRSCMGPWKIYERNSIKLPLKGSKYNTLRPTLVPADKFLRSDHDGVED